MIIIIIVVIIRTSFRQYVTLGCTVIYFTEHKVNNKTQERFEVLSKDKRTYIAWNG